MLTTFHISLLFIHLTIGFTGERRSALALASKVKLKVFINTEDTYCHVPEEEVTPLILDEEEESNDQEEVTNADEDDNYHSRVKRELKLKLDNVK